MVLRLCFVFIALIVVRASLNCECRGQSDHINSSVCGNDGLVYANLCIAECQGVAVVDKDDCQSNQYGYSLKFSSDQDVNIDETLIDFGFKYLGKVLSNFASVEKNYDDEHRTGWHENDKSFSGSFGSIFITREGQVYKAPNKDQYSNEINNEGIHPKIGKFRDNRKLLQVNFEQTVMRGEDTRKVVGAELSTQYPLSVIGTFANEECTGTLVSSHHVLTAAHCVFENGMQKTGLDFSPGQYGDSKPFGTIQWFGVQVPDQWIQNSDPAYDYAMVYLLEDVGDLAGALGYDTDCKNEYYNLNLAGYEWGSGFNPPGSMLHSYCTSVKMTCEDRTFTHECDAGQSQQGSALWVYIPNGRTDGDDLFSVRGVHSRVSDDGLYNLGMTVTPQVVQTLNEWITLN